MEIYGPNLLGIVFISWVPIIDHQPETTYVNLLSVVDLPRLEDGVGPFEDDVVCRVPLADGGSVTAEGATISDNSVLNSNQSFRLHNLN